MRSIIPIILIGIVAGLCSCESLVTTIPESKLPKNTEKIVLHAYISPQDTVILIKVTASNPLLGIYQSNGFGFSVIGNDTIYYTSGSIEDASVVLSDSRKQSVNIPYNKKEGIYMLDARQFPIVAGETYTITVEAQQGKVEASCTVPKENVLITDYKIDSLTQDFFDEKRKTFRVNFDWKDIPNVVNYYTVKASILTKMLLTPIDNSRPSFPIERMMKYISFWDEENRQSQYQSDINLDGTVFSSPNGFILLSIEAVYENGKRYRARFAGEKSTISLEVLNTDKNYYDYHRAVRINNRQDGNPFVEPVPIPTNVKNGLGCFAASNKTILTVVY